VPSAAGADRAGTASRAGSAATANSAITAGSVGGVTFKPIAYTASPGSPAQTVLDAGGLRLTGKCLLGADIELTATTTVDNAAIYGGGFDTDSPGQTGANDLETGDFDTAGSFDVLQAFDFAAPDGNPEMGTLVYTRPGAPSVTVLLAIDESGTQCFVHGHALIG
jgi:hypothetical protein